MGMLDTLVVGVDGSAASAQAKIWGAERLSTGGTLHLVTARAGPASHREQAEDVCGVRTKTHVVDGEPVHALLTLAEEVRADAIVVGPHSAPHRFGTLGRVTRRLLQHSTRPIIVARAKPRGEAVRSPVVACVGYGDATERAAEWAAEHATEHGLDLTLLHVVGYRPFYPADSPSDMLASYFGSDVLRDWADEDLKEIQRRIELDHPSLDVDTAVETGFASRAIVSASNRAGLVVVGKRQDTPALRSFISPRIHQLVAKAGCSVGVIPCTAET